MCVADALSAVEVGHLIKCRFGPLNPQPCVPLLWSRAHLVIEVPPPHQGLQLFSGQVAHIVCEVLLEVACSRNQH